MSDDAHHRIPLGEASPHDAELGHEDGEGRHPGDGEGPKEKQQPGSGHRLDRVADARHLGGAVALGEITGDEEQQRLGHGVIEQVQQPGVEAERAAEANRRGDQADVLHAAVGQQPLQVALHQDEGHRDDDREEAEAEQELEANSGETALEVIR